MIKPILFSTPMIQAIIAGRKTQTRRIIKSRHESGMFQVSKNIDGIVTGITSIDLDERPKNDTTNDIKPIAMAGDILWCRETWAELKNGHKETWIEYKANGADNRGDNGEWNWKPSIFMPKEACRLFLKVIGVRAERLQDISEDDAIAEGIIGVDRAGGHGYGLKKEWNYNFPLHERTAILAYKELWQSINGKESWDANPWVWVYEFEATDKPKEWPSHEVDINTLKGGASCK